ncbi:MAG: hypothetical protein ROW48_13670 [Bellilinea sp.]|jgi:hypothetical protein
MSKDEIIQKIMFECIAGEGFLTQLRARKFQKEKFMELVRALMDYRELIRDANLIDRSIAYCVYVIDNEMSAALVYFPHDDNEKLEIETAVEICTPLIHEILAPEWMTGPLPDEYK